MLDGEEKLFLKAVAIVKKLNHSNVSRRQAVGFYDGVCLLRVSSLGDLLRQNKAEYHCKGFEQMIAFAAKEVVRGHDYLHENGVAHRDLKPVNILVSNQHCSTREGEIAREFYFRPVVCKLTDFGESCSRFLQTLFLPRKLDE